MISISVTSKADQVHAEAVEEGVTLMQVLRDSGRVDAVCGGEMACGTCAVRVAEPWRESLEPSSDTERGLLEGLGIDEEGVRLSCQITLTTVLDGLTVSVLQGS